MKKLALIMMASILTVSCQKEETTTISNEELILESQSLEGRSNESINGRQVVNVQPGCLSNDPNFPIVQYPFALKNHQLFTYQDPPGPRSYPTIESAIKQKYPNEYPNGPIFASFSGFTDLNIAPFNVAAGELLLTPQQSNLIINEINCILGIYGGIKEYKVQIDWAYADKLLCCPEPFLSYGITVYQ